MDIINVELGTRSYPIFIGTSLFDGIADLIKPYICSRAMVVSDQNVAPLYGDKVLNALNRFDYQAHLHVLPPGETSKTPEKAMELYTEALKFGLDRRSCFIALGGGVIGDLTGFVAATYMRGINFIQIPTSLLAQVDSSVGGKVAVDHPMAKNIIGAFHQPKAVFIDIDTLETLPARELSAGLAEVIKYGAGLDEAFFNWLEDHIYDIMSVNEAALAYAVKRSCQIKADIVQADETEQGQRTLLNLGHTFAHAIETAAGYGRYLHGEAVAMGMVYAARLAFELGLVEHDYIDRLTALLRACRLPLQPEGINMDQLIPIMQYDKKAANKSLVFVLPTGIGHSAIFDNIPADMLLKL